MWKGAPKDCEKCPINCPVNVSVNKHVKAAAVATCKLSHASMKLDRAVAVWRDQKVLLWYWMLTSLLSVYVFVLAGEPWGLISGVCSQQAAMWGLQLLLWNAEKQLTRIIWLFKASFMCTVGFVNHSYAQSCYIKSSDDHSYCLDCTRNCT